MPAWAWFLIVGPGSTGITAVVAGFLLDSPWGMEMLVLVALLTGFVIGLGAAAGAIVLSGLLRAIARVFVRTRRGHRLLDILGSIVGATAGAVATLLILVPHLAVPDDLLAFATFVPAPVAAIAVAAVLTSRRGVRIRPIEAEQL